MATSIDRPNIDAHELLFRTSRISLQSTAGNETRDATSPCITSATGATFVHASVQVGAGRRPLSGLPLHSSPLCYLMLISLSTKCGLAAIRIGLNHVQHRSRSWPNIEIQ